ncbi:MAG: bifunctional diaminohydroxyphosphoribosylaminopyrimidine deaminase/5-amino-6-(5-phosphoribosylamino)uracil reductase RibD [Acidobacteria bacterium]|nr:bifunctional diaminohydroxyphosphoribosylaminopyrimidine deaminase/5-amino-6-(5-phosphoribosylamino)uracil reductase RibD [Acidobacteriota bacterium]
MRRAFRLARSAEGLAHPNPMVGAVVVAGGRIVGSGAHRYAKILHAERLALSEAGGAARGADLYVTLEPCCHHGRTPPCAEAVIEAGIRRVFVGTRDPNPLVAGGGIRRLQEAGLEVVTAPDPAPFDELNRKFNKYITTGTPWVTLKAGLSLDGRIATASGRSRWVTGAAARRWGHHLRFTHDAILVGRGTVRTDDPMLTCRHRREKETPFLRVVLDSRARIPAGSQLVRSAREHPLLVFVTTDAPPGRVRALEKEGVDVHVLPVKIRCEERPPARGVFLDLHPKNPRVDPAAVLKELGRRGVASVLVEGGGIVHAQFLAPGLADEFHFFFAPLFLGSEGPPVLGELGVFDLQQAPRARIRRVRALGPDLQVTGYFRTGART